MSIFKSEKIEKSLGVVLDVLFALVLLFSLFMTVSTLAQRENGVAVIPFSFSFYFPPILNTIFGCFICCSR